MQTKILGHRGSKHFPENMLAAFEDALIHADGFEFDVQYTRDGRPVVIHDDTVDRTTKGQGRVDSYTLEGLKQLDAGIPSLDEVMELADQYIQKRPDIIINIEIKDIRATASVIAMVEAYIKNKHWRYDNVIVSSFEHEALRQAKRLNANIPLGVLYEPEQEEMVERVIAELDPYAVHPSLTEMKSEVFSPLRCGKKLVVWIYGEKPYPDNMPEINKLLEDKPFVLITNYPKEVKAHVKQ